MENRPPEPVRPGPALLFVISGPAGVGKTTVCGRLREVHAGQLRRAVSATTRPPREGETDGVDYHFLSLEEFARRLDRGDFYEWARIHGQERFYGTLREEVDGKLAAGLDVMLVIDVQGAASLRRLAGSEPELARRLVTVFIHPESLDTLRERLDGRGTETGEELERRLRTAREELAHWNAYDYCLVSRDRESDFRHLEAIYLAEKQRVRA